MKVYEWCPECDNEITANVKKDVWVIPCPECGKPLYLCDKCFDYFAIVDDDGYIRRSDRPCENGNGICPAEEYLRTHKIK